jgi:hypothetical protein
MISHPGSDHDGILGHQAEAMRKRYQHHFPKGVKHAIQQLL